MFRNYIKVAVRNILKHKFFSAINILGMTIGVTACLLIILYVADEISYDRFHAKSDHIYRVDLHGKLGGQEVHTASSCPPLAAALISDIPDVEEATRLAPYFGQAIIKYEGAAFTEEKVFYADSNFFDVFSFQLLEGDADHALNEPNSVVLTQATARKYFGNENPLGKLMTIGGGENNSYKVTGISAEAPSNSHFKYDFLISASSSDNLKSNFWLNNFLYTYFVLSPNSQAEEVETKLDGLVQKYVGPELEKFAGVSMTQMKEQGGAYGYYLTKMTDIHLRSKSQHEIEPGGNLSYVYFFGAIAIFIIVIACINFMNLSTAKSSGRAKEVGLRKTLGSLRGQMIGQFLAESFMYSLLAVLFSIAATYILLPSFNLISGKQLTINFLTDPTFIIGIAGLIIFVSLVAGSYPAFYLTSFSAVEVLKGKARAGLKSKGIRSILVVCQFAISIFLITFTAVVYQQLKFMQSRDMGIDKHNVLVLQNLFSLGNNTEAFRNSVAAHSGVASVSFTNNNFPGVNNTTIFRKPGIEEDHIMGIFSADYDYADVVKLNLIEGRFFSKDFPSDSSAVLLNEAAVKEFGFEKPLEEHVIFVGNNNQKLNIIGVYKDFNFESLKHKIRPLAIRLQQRGNLLFVRYQGNAAGMVGDIEKLWKQHGPQEPYEYTFLDENFDELFRAEQRMSTIFNIFSGLAIFIACLGLFALAAFTAEQRTKEIGIRKAMGATVGNLTLLLSKEFTRLVIIAFVPATLAAWYVINQWLEGFQYRVEVNPLVFIMSGIVAIIIAWLTVGYQSVKAASANPVNSLRYE